MGETMSNLVDRHLRQARVALLALCAGLLAACASNTGKFPAAPSAAATQGYSYIIGPGDSLNIIVWRNPELSMAVPVRPDGKFSTPLIDELTAQGKNSVEISREIEKQLSKYVRDPVVTVVVTSFVGPYDQQIRVVGEAAKPQVLAYKQNMTLLDVMIAVGGLTDFAAGNEATILRKADGDKQYSVRLKDLIKRGDVSANVEMKPGDILIIPQSFF
jgi:polysaccharide export outer membrane protein